MKTFRENFLHYGKIKEHQCEFCGKPFSRKSGLTTQKSITVHDKLKQHPCKISEKLFSQRVNLRRHVATA